MEFRKAERTLLIIGIVLIILGFIINVSTPLLKSWMFVLVGGIFFIMSIVSAWNYRPR